MGRTREFDADAVIERATRLFWRLGYDAVTIGDLEVATGVGRGSLYNAFGDKEGLFLAAFDNYVEKYGSAPLAHLSDPDVVQGLRRMFGAIVARMSNPDNPRGCLITNTSLAAIAGAGRIQARLTASLSAMERRLEEAIDRARRDRQIPGDTDPKSLARFYGAVAQSLGVEHKVFGDRNGLDDIVAVAMQRWPAQGHRRSAGSRAAKSRRPRTASRRRGGP